MTTETLVDLLVSLRGCPANEVEDRAAILADALEDLGRDEGATWVRKQAREWCQGLRPPIPPLPVVLMVRILDRLTVHCPDCNPQYPQFRIPSDHQDYGPCERCGGQRFLLRPE